LTIITSFSEKKKERQILFERSVLRELTIDKLKKSVQLHFGIISTGSGFLMDQAVEEGCYDIAVESYILGSQFSRFGYYGEEVNTAMDRAHEEIQQLSNALNEFIDFWTMSREEDESHTIFSKKCKPFVVFWWKEGFQTGMRKYKLRLH
jgi:hypothetical protein